MHLNAIIFGLGVCFSAGRACREELSGVGGCTAKIVRSKNLVIIPFALRGTMNGDADATHSRVGPVGGKRWGEGLSVAVLSPISSFALLRLRRGGEISGLGFDNLGWGRGFCRLKLTVG
jgi:hypothetical protein